MKATNKYQSITVLTAVLLSAAAVRATADVVTDWNQITLSATKTAGLNSNQTQVAGAIDRTFNAGVGSAGSALAGLYGSSPSALPSSLSQLSGEVATGAPTTAFRATDSFSG